MTTQTIEKMIDAAAEEIRASLHEMIGDIQAAASAALEASMESEADAKIGIGCRIGVNMSKHAWNVTCSVPITRKITSEFKRLSDPAQPELGEWAETNEEEEIETEE